MAQRRDHVAQCPLTSPRGAESSERREKHASVWKYQNLGSDHRRSRPADGQAVHGFAEDFDSDIREALDPAYIVTTPAVKGEWWWTTLGTLAWRDRLGEPHDATAVKLVRMRGKGFTVRDGLSIRAAR